MTCTSVGGGAEEPPLPRQPVKNMAAIATMLIPEYRFIFNHSQLGLNHNYRNKLEAHFRPRTIRPPDSLHF
jgi:hypothetical protein